MFEAAVASGSGAESLYGFAGGTVAFGDLREDDPLGELIQDAFAPFADPAIDLYHIVRFLKGDNGLLGRRPKHPIDSKRLLEGEVFVKIEDDLEVTHRFIVVGALLAIHLLADIALRLEREGFAVVAFVKHGLGGESDPPVGGFDVVLDLEEHDGDLCVISPSTVWLDGEMESLVGDEGDLEIFDHEGVIGAVVVDRLIADIALADKIVGTVCVQAEKQEDQE